MCYVFVTMIETRTNMQIILLTANEKTKHTDSNGNVCAVAQPEQVQELTRLPDRGRFPSL
jgi:hypothetical protein